MACWVLKDKNLLKLAKINGNGGGRNKDADFIGSKEKPDYQPQKNQEKAGFCGPFLSCTSRIYFFQPLIKYESGI